MDQNGVESVIRSLNQHQVQYLIVGGLAVVAHGYMRFTADIDLLLAVDSANLTKIVAALKSLDYRPRAPVPIEDFIDPKKRQEWATQKNMMVFSLNSPRYPRTEVDLFLESPIDFGKARDRSVRFEVAPGVDAPFCSIADLIELKTIAGRQRDLEDIAKLRQIQKGTSP